METIQEHPNHMIVIKLFIYIPRVIFHISVLYSSDSPDSERLLSAVPSSCRDFLGSAQHHG